jgi:FixJ family two-component response regulator
MQKNATVYIVDDSPDVIVQVQAYLGPGGYALKAYDSPAAFLADLPIELPGCLLLDNLMPGMKGVELFQHASDALDKLPVIFMSGDSSYEDVFAVSRNGAFAFLQKPVAKERLLAIVADAVRLSRELIAQHDSVHEEQARYDQLTAREKEIFRLLIEGMPNKLVARRLDIALRTVEFHRANVFRKLGKSLLVELIALSRRIRY